MSVMKQRSFVFVVTANLGLFLRTYYLLSIIQTRLQCIPHLLFIGVLVDMQRDVVYVS